MSGRDRGYTMVELLVVMAIFGVFLTVISVSFGRIVTSSSEINRSVESEIGGLIGLEMFRQDLGLAGFGLPWSIPGSVIFDEAPRRNLVRGCPDGCPGAASHLFNDNVAPNNVPRALVLGDNVGYNDSDYLVLKGTPLGGNSTCQGWSYLSYSSSRTQVKPSRSDFELKLGNHERVIVMSAGIRGGSPVRELVSNGASFSVTFDDPLPGEFSPRSREDHYLVYGIAPEGKVVKPDPDSPARPAPLDFPFNRSDYYLSRPADISRNCAPSTAVLYKTSLNQNDSTTADLKNSVTYYPLLDCVGDMQVMFLLDSNGDEMVDLHTNDLRGYSPRDIREQVREVRVYILAHQGKKDSGYTFPGSEIVVGDPRHKSLGRVWDQERLGSRFGSDWRHYRWKVYTIAVQPGNLQ